MRESHNLGSTMFTSKWRHLCISCLLLISPLAADPADSDEECGRILSGPDRWYTIYVLCPNLPKMSPEQARSVIVAVLDGTTRKVGDTRIFFFRDESVLRRDRRPADQGRLIESWGDAFVGAYHTRSQLLTVRSTTNNEWRNIHLPTARR